MSSIADSLVAAANELSMQVGRLKFSEPVTHVYNPLTYAWNAHEEYLRKYGDSRKHVLFLGMNPGPFGMVQTGIPFGEVAAVRDWLKIHAQILRPKLEHPKRPILGFDCERSEVSGRRLWGLFSKRFGSPEKFFAEHFVTNYCPLAFCEESGRNLTPDKLRRNEHDRLFAVCDAHLRRQVEIFGPEVIIGIGGFAAERAELVAGKAARIVQILHPSPASPAANRNDWTVTAANELIRLGVWK